MNKNFNLSGIDLISAKLLNDFLNGTVSDYPFKKEKLASLIDHTLLKPEATEDEVIKICYEAKEYSFVSVCVNPSLVLPCVKILDGSSVKVCTVIGFPLGANTVEVKSFEAEQAMRNGAGEIDMVINIGKLKSKDYNYVFYDINQVVQIAKSNNGLCKVIIENALLTDEEKVKACILAKEGGADFVKTSTGFSKSGAQTSDVALMRYVVGKEMGVKASGGIRTFEDAQRMIENGASRLGTSAGVQIIKGITGTEKTVY
jgi:deoxyribose-phosphate aldolase